MSTSSSSSSSSSSSASSSRGEGETASGHEGKDEARSGNDDQQEDATSDDDDDEDAASDNEHEGGGTTPDEEEEDEAARSDDGRTYAKAGGDQKTEPPALKRSTSVIETTEQHLQRHTPRQEWRSCARCAYYHQRASLEKACSFEEEYTRERLCYLIEAPDLGNREWGVGCVICRWAKFKTPFAQCKICSLTMLRNISKLQRHVESAQHKRALEQWHRARAPRHCPRQA